MGHPRGSGRGAGKVKRGLCPNRLFVGCFDGEARVRIAEMGESPVY